MVVCYIKTLKNQKQFKCFLIFLESLHNIRNKQKYRVLQKYQVFSGYFLGCQILKKSSYYYYIILLLIFNLIGFFSFLTPLRGKKHTLLYFFIFSVKTKHEKLLIYVTFFRINISGFIKMVFFLSGLFTMASISNRNYIQTEQQQVFFLFIFFMVFLEEKNQK